MASTKEYLDFVMEQLSGLDEVSSRAMMGAYILYYRGRIFGGIYDDRLLVKPVPMALRLMPDAEMELPYNGAKEMILVDNVDDRQFLCELVESMWEELSERKSKKKMYLIFIIEFIILSVITYKMTISERILKVLKDRNMTQVEFAKQVGIATSTISEWKKKKTNPAADKIMNICNVLQITPEQLLTGKGIEDEEEIAAASPESRFTPYDIQLIEDFHGLKEEQQKRLVTYMEALKKIESLENM